MGNIQKKLISHKTLKLMFHPTFFFFFLQGKCFHCEVVISFSHSSEMSIQTHYQSCWAAYLSLSGSCFP